MIVEVSVHEGERAERDQVIACLVDGVTTLLMAIFAVLNVMYDSVARRGSEVAVLLPWALRGGPSAAL